MSWIAYTPALAENEEQEFSFDKFMQGIPDAPAIQPKLESTEDQLPQRKLNTLYRENPYNKIRVGGK